MNPAVDHFCLSGLTPCPRLKNGRLANLAFIRSLPELTEVKIAGRHYVQEDPPDDIGRAVAEWMRALS